MASKKTNNKQTGNSRYYKNIFVISFLCAAVFVAVLFWPHHDPSKHIPALASGQTPAASTQPAVGCPAPDQSFCATQISFIKLVEHGSFATALEHQQPVHVTCGSPEVETAYCDTATAGTVLNAYKLVVNGSAEYVSRNEFIAYFSSFQKDFGPFKFVRDTTSGTNLTMHFKGSKNATTYEMTFSKRSGNWVLQSVAVD